MQAGRKCLIGNNVILNILDARLELKIDLIWILRHWRNFLFPFRNRAVMPGMVMFRRRWSVGSDDLVLPALFLFLLHCIWWVSVSAVVWIPTPLHRMLYLVIGPTSKSLQKDKVLSSLSNPGWWFCPWFSSAFGTAQTCRVLSLWWTMAEDTWASLSAALYVRAPSCGWVWGAAFCTHSPGKLCSMWFTSD